MGFMYDLLCVPFLGSLFAYYSFSLFSKPIAVPVVHATYESNALGVLQSGFAVSPEMDKGYYGQGIYSTSDIDYASMYYSGKGRPWVCIVCVATPGNPYPVTEPPSAATGSSKPSHEGMACVPGYQSHYTVVNRESIQSAYPTTSEDVEGDLQKRWVADELVLFESGQLLPLFMVSYNPPPPPPPRPRKEAKPADISDLDVSNSGFFSDKSAPRPKEMQEIASN